MQAIAPRRFHLAAHVDEAGRRLRLAVLQVLHRVTRRQAALDLSRADDHILADIGITRDEIGDAVRGRLERHRVLCRYGFDGPFDGMPGRGEPL